MTSSSEAVTTARHGERTLVITLDRPEVRNAIDSSISKGVLAALTELDDDPELRVGVLTGSGGTFCAGLDLKAFAEEGLPRGVGKLYRHGARKPVVAAVEGIAYGGGLELALVADLIVAADDARFAASEVRFGLFPGGGALLKLPRTVPQSVVARMALTGEPITAREAFDRGLVVELTPPGGALDAALALAAVIARNGPMGVEATKHLLRYAPGHDEEAQWAEQNRLVTEVFGSEQAAEGARAFAEKRPPNWV